MEPIDYSGAFANIQSPAQAFTQGLQGGVALQQVQAEQAQQQAAFAQKQQMQADLAALSANPTPQAIAAASLKYPQLSEQFKRSLDMLTPEQQKAKIAAAAPVHAAALSGEYGVAAKQLREHADALQNSGNDQEAQQTRAMADLVEQHPETATVTTGMLLASAMGPDKYAASFKDIGAETRATAAEPTELRKKAADAGTAEADLTAKNLSIVAQKAGALAKPGVKPEQAATMFRSLAAQGVIPKADLQGYIDGIPTDPTALPDYLRQVQASGMKADDQMKFTTPDANSQLQSETTKRGQDITANTAAARLKFDKDQADAADAPDNTPDNEKKLWVHQYVAGNGSVPRSAPASVRNHIGTWAAQMGITPADLSSGSAQAKFDQASAVTSGHRAGSMASVEATMPALTANARDLSHQLDQGKFVPLNQLVQMANDKISDPKLTAFKIAHQAVVSEYQQVISRGGTNVTALREAMHVLNSAKSAEAYDAALNQVDKEVAINVAGTKGVRAGLGGAHGASAAPPATPAIPAGWSVREH
jgi:hypothetical protein